MPIKTRKKTVEGEPVPAAVIGDTVAAGYPDCFSPQYEDNMRKALNVCICDGCEDAKPRLKELAETYRLTLTFKDKDGDIKPLYKLFE